MFVREVNICRFCGGFYTIFSNFADFRCLIIGRLNGEIQRMIGIKVQDRLISEFTEMPSQVTFNFAIEELGREEGEIPSK